MYRNPILPGYHPDPSVCRVGEDYYLVTSTFEFFPGVPIFHSRDLVHWRQLGYCLTRPSQLPLEKACPSGGIFAPALRYHDGVFYLITTNVTGGGNFLVTAADPAGPWSEPVWIDPEEIDPSLFFDDDGAVYFHSTGNGGIRQFRIDPHTGQRLSDERIIWSGTGGRYPEGPHLYKIDGSYYLMIAEGGTEYGHMMTIARGTSPWGPFAPCPHNPILTHRNRGGHPIQGTGHADLVQAHDGRWWMVFLGFRPQCGMYHHLGRETFLAPVTWVEGWPLVNGNGTVELEMATETLPAHPWPALPVRDDFDAAALALPWNYLRNPHPQEYSLTARPGWLRLHGSALTLDAVDSPAFVGRRQQHLSCRVRTRLDADPSDQDEAGLTVYMSPGHHYEIARSTGKVFVRRRIGDLCALVAECPLAAGPVILGIDARPDCYTFVFSQDDTAPTELATGVARFLSSEVAGGFTGVYFGLYATGNGQPARTPADFDWFDYQPLDELCDILN